MYKFQYNNFYVEKLLFPSYNHSRRITPKCTVLNQINFEILFLLCIHQQNNFW